MHISRISVWAKLDRPRSGLIVHQYSNLGVTFGDPVAYEVVDDSDKEDDDSGGRLEDYGDMDISADDGYLGMS